MKLQSSSRKFGASLPGSCNDREYNFLAKSIWSLLAAFDFGFDADDAAADDDDDVKNLFKDNNIDEEKNKDLFKDLLEWRKKI